MLWIQTLLEWKRIRQSTTTVWIVLLLTPPLSSTPLPPSLPLSLPLSLPPSLPPSLSPLPPSPSLSLLYSIKITLTWKGISKTVIIYWFQYERDPSLNSNIYDVAYQVILMIINNYCYHLTINNRLSPSISLESLEVNSWSSKLWI